MSVQAHWRYDPRTREWVLAIWAPDGAPAEVFATLSAVSLAAVAPRARQAVAESIWQRDGIRPPAGVFDGPPDAPVSMTCPQCWAVWFNPLPVAGRYCETCSVGPERDTDEAALRSNPELVARMERSINDPSVRSSRPWPQRKPVES